MQASDFIDNRTGELVAVSGIPGIKHAFIPAPLPPHWSWPTALWPLLLEARTSLAQLDGIGAHLPNPELLMRPLQNREAIRSSSLEGTYADPQEQALFQLDPKYPQSTDDPVNAHREVFNYGTALRLRLANKDGIPLSLRLIKNLHSILMEGVRGSDRNPGHFRTTQNQIGRPARYVPPPVPRLAQTLDAFEKYLHTPSPYDPLVNAFLVHYQFEAIHPFLDGNGRVGRLLLSVLIAEWCGLSNQWLYMSAYFDANKNEYINGLLRISTHGEWAQWIEFCLRGAIAQAKDAKQRCERLLALNKDFRQRVRAIRGSVRLSSMIDDLFDSPVALVTHVAQKHHVTYPTARSDLKKLENAGILVELTSSTSVAYWSREIFDITYADVV